MSSIFPIALLNGSCSFRQVKCSLFGRSFVYRKLTTIIMFPQFLLSMEDGSHMSVLGIELILFPCFPWYSSCCRWRTAATCLCRALSWSRWRSCDYCHTATGVCLQSTGKLCLSGHSRPKSCLLMPGSWSGHNECHDVQSYQGSLVLS